MKRSHELITRLRVAANTPGELIRDGVVLRDQVEGTDKVSLF
jgi:hypothetical protein